TGASSGIGRALVHALAADGLRVAFCARREDKLDELVRELERSEPMIPAANLLVRTVDLRRESQIVSLFDRIREKWGGVDVLINNAGITGHPEKQRFGSIDYASFDDVMDTNVRGPLKMSEAFAANVAASATKKIVVVTSSEGSISDVRSNRQPFYRSSKAAVNMMMKNIAYSLKDQGITVVLVNPGPVDTDMMAAVRGRMPLRSTELAVREMMAVTDKATLETTATFWNFDGTVMPW
ncbi:MAG: SDR family NAD(P)-dependent oxidoreductase, partial [Rhodobacteraceae bacterium]|nr:SDR family NAD(P)-dependent oxidoreductase [Paracoccaceae bacterium]